MVQQYLTGKSHPPAFLSLVLRQKGFSRSNYIGCLGCSALWSSSENSQTGSSYPAILDEDVKKTLIPVPSIELQKKMVAELNSGLAFRERAIEQANEQWKRVQESVEASIAMPLSVG
ncbi:MAG: hypothetical protein M2R45_03228 [Verrucomicrobia subdivision 3 bacterium]|nr:hypothetical protein [Limisphaerales bacterium]MCS1416089.1 hypothetical protein [Limisphaerales bacterium]